MVFAKHKNLTFILIRIVLLTLLCYNVLLLNGQSWKFSANPHPGETDSLKYLIRNAKNDTVKIILYEELSKAYRYEKKMDSCVLSLQQATEINIKTNYSLQKQCWEVASIDYILFEMANYLESLKYAVQHLALSEQLNDTSQKGEQLIVSKSKKKR